MKIRSVSEENQAKAAGLLKQVFGPSSREVRLVERLHKRGAVEQDWVCIHKGRVIGYIAFTRAYIGETGCGLHLAPVAVNPEYQNRGVGSELIRFALRQKCIATEPVFVIGEPRYFSRFGFVHCKNPGSPLTKNNKNFLGLRNEFENVFTVGYEKEFHG